MFVKFNGQTLILKMIEKEVFLLKPKHQYHLSQCGECIYGAQSLKKKRLFHESMFIPIDRQTFTLKNGGK